MSFTSDNGFAPAADVPAHARSAHDPSAGYRGFKSDLFEGGHRVPFIAHGPATIPAGTITAALVGAPVPTGAAEDSVSFLPLLRGEQTNPKSRTALVSRSAEGRFAIQSDQWKLLLWPGSGGWSSPTPAPSVWLKTTTTDLATLPPFQRYDLSVDPAEKNNLAVAHPEIVRRLGLQPRALSERDRESPADWPQLAWRRDFVP